MSAITVPGIVLSQPESAPTPSKRWPRTTSSTESAITSRLTREARMPSVPMEMPSETEIVLNSIGVPPAARTPAFTCSASRRKWKLHGITSIQVLAMPMSGFFRSSSVNPIPFIIARAGARLSPSRRTLLCRLKFRLISPVDAGLRRDFLPPWMLHFLHLSHQIGAVDQRLGRVAPGQNQMQRRRLRIEQPQHLVQTHQLHAGVIDGVDDFIQHHQIIGAGGDLLFGGLQ